MKTLILSILILICSGVSAQSYKPTKHKPVKTMKASKVKKVQNGKNLYFRDSAGVHKNNLKNRMLAKVRKEIGKL